MAKMNPRQLDMLTSLVQDQYSEVQAQVLANIIKRLNDDSLEKLERDDVLRWQIEKLKELGLFTDETIKEIEGKVNKSHAVVDNVMNVLAAQINDDIESKLVKVTGKEMPRTNEVDHLMRGFARVAKDNLDNHINETLLTRNADDSTVAKAYRDILSGTVAKVLTGASQPREALQQTIYKWQERGLESGLIDRAGRQWNLQTYANLVMNSIVPQAYAETVKTMMDDYGYHLVVYPEFNAAREACAPMQGQVVNLVPPESPDFNKKYDSVYNHGFGEPAGALGINCRHWHFTVFDPDIMDEPVQKVKPEDAIKQEKLVQGQRRMERAIRLSKERLKAAQELDDDVGTSHYQGLIRTQQAAMRYYINQHDGLVRQYSREQNLKNGGASRQAKAIMATKISSQKDEFESLKSEFGHHGFPKTLDSYRETLYNKYKSKILHAYTMSRKHGTVEPVVRYRDYVEKMAEIDHEIIGIKTSTGQVISEFSDHMIERAFGASHDASHNNAKRIGVSVADIKDILLNGIHSKSRNETTKYQGKSAYVIVNKYGKLITVVPRGRR